MKNTDDKKTNNWFTKDPTKLVIRIPNSEVGQDLKDSWKAYIEDSEQRLKLKKSHEKATEWFKRDEYKKLMQKSWEDTSVLVEAQRKAQMFGSAYHETIGRQIAEEIPSEDKTLEKALSEAFYSSQLNEATYKKLNPSDIYWENPVGMYTPTRVKNTGNDFNDAYKNLYKYFGDYNASNYFVAIDPYQSEEKLVQKPECIDIVLNEEAKSITLHFKNHSSDTIENIKHFENTVEEVLALYPDSPITIL